MSITLNLNPEVERGLTARARARGMSLADYLQELAAQEVARFPEATGVTGEERARAFLAWAESFPDTPPLSDEAIDRASMYPDR